MFTPDPKEIDTVLRLNLQQKYRYFVSKVADWGKFGGFSAKRSLLPCEIIIDAYYYLFGLLKPMHSVILMVNGQVYGNQANTDPLYDRNIARYGWRKYDSCHDGRQSMPNLCDCRSEVAITRFN